MNVWATYPASWCQRAKKYGLVAQETWASVKKLAKAKSKIDGTILRTYNTAPNPTNKTFKNKLREHQNNNNKTRIVVKS